MSLKQDNLIHMAKQYDDHARNCHPANYSEWRYRAFHFRKMARNMEEE